MMLEFAEMWDGLLGTVRKVEHRIETDPADALPIRSDLYRAERKARELNEEEIDKLVSINVAELEKSEWASPIVLILKKDGSLLFFVYYHRSDQMTVWDS